jgi:hypothetical protein
MRERERERGLCDPAVSTSEWRSSIGRCRRNGEQDLAIYGYYPEIKCKYLIIFLYFGLQNENQIYKSGDLKKYIYFNFGN